MIDWQIQGNALSEQDRRKLSHFILTQSRLTQGDVVKEFERKFAEWQGSKYAVFVNSGSLANLILISALKELYNWQDCDGIIVPAVTWSTTVTPIKQLGLKPVFVDINLNDLGFDKDGLSEAFHYAIQLQAIFTVHLLGLSANSDCVFTMPVGIIQMEDCCEALGTERPFSTPKKKVGTTGIAGTFSFYWAHHLTTIEGGMICTNDYDLYKMLLLKRSHGMARELPNECRTEIEELYPDLDYWFTFLTDGFNARGNNLTAYAGLIQLEQLDGFLEIRKRNYARFVKICKQYEDFLIILDAPISSTFSLPFIFKDKLFKEKFRNLLVKEGVEVRPLLGGNLLRHPAFKGLGYEPEDFPNAELLHFNAFYIGNHQGIGDQQLDWLDKKMKRFF